MTSTYSYQNEFSAVRAFDITPSDATEITTLHKGLWVGGSGDVRVQMWEGGSIVTLAGAVAGSLIPIRVKKVYATGTTATNIVALL